MNLNKFTLKAQEAVQKALELAQNGNNQAVEPAHILKAFLSDSESIVNTLLNKLGANSAAIIKVVDETLKRLPIVQGASVSGQYLSNTSKELFDIAQKEATKLGDEYISSEHILIGLASIKGEIASLLNDHNVTKENILKVLKDVRGNQTVDDPNAESRYGALKKYARDLNELAEKINSTL